MASYNLDTPSPFYLTIAGFNIELTFEKTDWKHKREIYKQILSSCKSFIKWTKPTQVDYFIEFVHKQNINILVLERGIRNYFNLFEDQDNQLRILYFISIYQFHLILRKVILNLISQQHGLLLHGSAVNANGEALIFIGPQGAGKSTAKYLLRNAFKPLADDVVALRRLKNRYYLYPLPYFETNKWFETSIDKLPVKAIFILKKAKTFKIKKLVVRSNIIRQISREYFVEVDVNPSFVKIFLTLIAKFDNFYYLYFRKEAKRFTRFLSKEVSQDDPTAINISS